MATIYIMRRLRSCPGSKLHGDSRRRRGDSRRDLGVTPLVHRKPRANCRRRRLLDCPNLVGTSPGLTLANHFLQPPTGLRFEAVHHPVGIQLRQHAKDNRPRCAYPKTPMLRQLSYFQGWHPAILSCPDYTKAADIECRRPVNRASPPDKSPDKDVRLTAAPTFMSDGLIHPRTILDKIVRRCIITILYR